MIQFDTEPAAANTHAMFKGNLQRSAKQAPRLFRAMQSGASQAGRPARSTCHAARRRTLGHDGALELDAARDQVQVTLAL